jgi:hypothetical protein
MNRRLLLFCCVLVGAIAAGVWLYASRERGGQEAGEEQRSALPADAVLGVDELMRDVDRFEGPVRIEGVVSAVSPGQKRLALIDRAEFEHCGRVDCAALVLPVEWAGAMPQVRQSVRLSGQVHRREGKLILVADSLSTMQADGGAGG